MTQAVTQPGVDKPEMYLRQRNGIWYFRRRIPSDLEGVIEPGCFHYSLGTRKRSEALQPYAAALARSEQEISEARQKLQEAAKEGRIEVRPTRRKRRQIEAEKAKRMRSRAFCQYSETEISFLIKRWFETEQSETEFLYRKAFTLNTPEQRLEIIKELGQEKSLLMENQLGIDNALVSGRVRSILDREDCEPPREWLSNPSFCRFYGLVYEGLLQLNRIATSLVENGQLPEKFQGPPAFVPASSQSTMPYAGLPSVNRGPSVTLDELIARFSADPKRKFLRENTLKEYTFPYRLLREQFGGEKPIAEITRDDIRAISDILLHLPARATLPRKGQKTGELLRDISARAKAAGEPQAKVKTYNKKIQQVGALFNWAETEQLISSSPARNLALPEPIANGEEKSYSSAQLQTIFEGELFTQFLAEGTANQFVPNHPLKPCLFWAPLFGLFHGARSGEILSLQTANVFYRDGVAVFKLEGLIKNQPSHRTAPIHPTMIRLGFLTYIEKVRQAGYEMAFPDAQQASDGHYSTWFQKPFSRYLTKIGIKTGRNECFHAFRHTWNTGMRRADASEEIRKAIAGWKRGDESSEGGYGSQHLPRLLKYLEKLEYPGLNLSHLMPENFGMERIRVRRTQ